MTEVRLGLTSAGAIYTVQIFGDDNTRSAIPSGGCNDFANTHTLTVAATERVTEIEAYRNSVGDWFKMKIKMNTGTTQEYIHASYTAADTLHTFTIPGHLEFTGLEVKGASSGCKVT